LSELGAYLEGLSQRLEVIVVDGSSEDFFESLLTGLDIASHDKVVIADEDIRYDAISLERVLSLLDEATSYARRTTSSRRPGTLLGDTGRTLLNRAAGGDWPGTLAVRRSLLDRTQGYDRRCALREPRARAYGAAAGGREAVPLDLFVRRLPSTTPHFLSQRVRQAYDEFARPRRLALVS